MSTTARPHNAGHRRDALWIAAMVHRISGLALACFLPLHFLALGLAIQGEARLDGFLKWTANPAVKLAESGLVFLLAVHMLGGIRVLVSRTCPGTTARSGLPQSPLSLPAWRRSHFWSAPSKNSACSNGSRPTF